MNNGKKILIIEDDTDIQEIYRTMISDTFEEVDIEQCYNGKEGLAAAQKNKPDLILLDLLMPVMDGETFLKYFRHDDGFKQVPVIVCSVNQTLAHKLLKHKEVEAVLPKIFPLADFVKLVSKFLHVHPKTNAPGL